MSSKTQTALKTKPYEGDNPLAKGMHARQVTLTDANIADIHDWLGDSSTLTWEETLAGPRPKFRIKTKKGIRVAVEGDTIVKVGTRQNGNVPEFFVIKKV